MSYIRGSIKGDTRSLDYSSYSAPHVWQLQCLLAATLVGVSKVSVPHSCSQTCVQLCAYALTVVSFLFPSSIEP